MSITFTIELPEHMQTVIRQDAREQAGLVRGSSVATGLATDFPWLMARKKTSRLALCVRELLLLEEGC
jgi:hypothetical protein